MASLPTPLYLNKNIQEMADWLEFKLQQKPATKNDLLKRRFLMIVQQFFVNGLAHASYLLADRRPAPSSIPGVTSRSISMLQGRRLKITHILRNAPARRFCLATWTCEKTGAKIYAPKSGDVELIMLPWRKGIALRLKTWNWWSGNTGPHPGAHCLCGHRPFPGRGPGGPLQRRHAVCRRRGASRPLSRDRQELAEKLYDSLNRKILKLPDFCEVYPAHGAGSLCGRALSAKRTSTVGYEKKYNYAFQIRDAPSSSSC